MRRARRKSCYGLRMVVVLRAIILWTLLGACGGKASAPEPVAATTALVSVTWLGADPETLERAIAEPLEAELNRVAGVTRLRTLIRGGQVDVAIELADTDLTPVRDAVRTVMPRLPPDAEVPIVRRAGDATPRWLVLRSATFSQLDLARLADERVRRLIERMAGVTEVEVCAGGEPEVTIALDGERLARYGLAPSQVLAALSNQDVPAGRIVDEGREPNLRAGREARSIQELAATPITTRDDVRVALHDVAQVSVGTGAPRCAATLRRAPVVGLRVHGGDADLGALRVELPAGVELVEVVDVARDELAWRERAPQWNGRTWPPPGGEATPSLRFTLDRERAAALGVSASDVAAVVALVLEGRVVARVDDLPVRLRVGDGRVDAWRDVSVAARDGRRVPLRDLGRIEDVIEAPRLRVDRQTWRP